MVIGESIGHYRILAKVGEGGMGEVYRARDSKLQRDVAIKILPNTFASDPDRLMRFEREAKTLASLNHAHIGQIYGVEDTPSDAGGHTRALVMELVEGEDLAERLARGPVPIDEALAMARQIASALEAAHDAGVIHRDLKPANVKVKADGTVKVLDFGLAKAIAPAEAGARDASHTAGPGFSQAAVTSPAVTQAGMLLGTAAYMSPEQAKGKPVDKRADIWAFGCVLYEMLTGAKAFGREDISETIASVLKEKPALAALPADTPHAIRRVLRRCLEKDPARRLRDIADARLEIEEAVTGDPENAPAPRPPASHVWWRRIAWSAVGALVGMAIAIVVLQRWDTSPPPPVARLTITPSAAAPLQVNLGESDLTISADGRRVIYRSLRTDPDGIRTSSGQLVMRPLDAFEGMSLTDVGRFPSGPFTSPDGVSIAMQTTTGAGSAPVLAKTPLAGGPMTVICDLAPLGLLRGGSWTTDGRIVFATNQLAGGLYEVPAAGGTPTLMTSPETSQGERDHLWPEVLPNNAGILFTIARADSTFDIAVLPPGSSAWRVVIRGGTAPRYLPSGHLVYVSAGVLRAVGFDVRTLAVTTEFVALVDNVLTKESGAANVAVSANGTLAYVPGGQQKTRYRLAWLNRDGTTVTLPLEPRAYRAPRLSPDGRFIAVTLEEQATTSIWLYDIARETFTRLTPRGESTRTPIWSPDGRRLAYWSETEKGLFMMPIDITGSPTRLTEVDNREQYPNAWSPDGAQLLFLQGAPDLDLFVVSTASPHDVRPIAVGPSGDVEADVSPNGRWVAYVSFDGREPEVVAGSLEAATGRRPVAGGGRYPIWSRDGRELLYLNDGAIHRIGMDPATGLATGKPTRVVDLPRRMNAVRQLSSAPDGTRFLMMETVEADDQASEIRIVLNWMDEVKAKMATAAPVAVR
jgi:serine/threonine-protein kinase